MLNQVQHDTKSIHNNYISEFGINGKHYLICQRPSLEKESSRSKMNLADANASVVGELTIKRNRYMVIQNQEDNRLKEIKRTVSPSNLLTRKELQIVNLVAQGKVNKQIADQLRISEWTVATHLRRIFAKLGVKKRTEMVYWCSQSNGSTTDPSAYGSK